MSKREGWAIELRLSKWTADVNEYGVNVSGAPVERVTLLSHYDGSRTEAEAQHLYEACERVLKNDDAA